MVPALPRNLLPAAGRGLQGLVSRERLCFTLLLLRFRSPGGGPSAPAWAGRPCPGPDERRQPCPRRSGCHQRSAFSALTIGWRRGGRKAAGEVRREFAAGHRDRPAEIAEPAQDADDPNEPG